MKKILLYILLAIGVLLIIFGVVLYAKGNVISDVGPSSNLDTNTRWYRKTINTLKLCDDCAIKMPIEYFELSNEFDNKELQQEIKKLNDLSKKAYESDKDSGKCASKGYNISTQTTIETNTYDNKDLVSLYYYTITYDMCNSKETKTEPKILVISKKTNKEMSDKELLDVFQYTEDELKIMYDLALQAHDLEGSIKDYKTGLFVNGQGNLVLSFYKDTNSEYYTKIIKNVKKIQKNDK